MKNQGEKKKKFNFINLLNRNNNNQGLQGKIDELKEIWEEIREKYVEKEIKKIKEETDNQLNDISKNFRDSIELFLGWWEEDYRRENKKEKNNSHYRLSERTMQFKSMLIKNQGIEEKWIKKLCEKKERLMKLESILLQEDDIDGKIKLLREIIDYNSAMNKKNLELKKQISELEMNIEELQKQLQKGKSEKEELILPIEKPTLKHLVAKGGYGEVHYGEWKRQEVAVKKLYLLYHDNSESDIKDIQKEINILKNLRNKHIIQYYGTYSDNQEILIIMEYAENGTLTKFINNNKDREHDWEFNKELIKQITLGLIYIHHENIIHRDLKSMNILLTNNYQVKISDFGLSRVKSISTSQSKNMKGTLGWMAPELLKGGKYSEQSDIYALGVIIWEIVAKCTVPPIAKKEKGIIPDNSPQNIYNIIKQCWRDNPDERINLESILESTNVKLDHQSLSQTQTYEKIENQSIATGLSNQIQFDFTKFSLKTNDKSEITAELAIQIQQPTKY